MEVAAISNEKLYNDIYLASRMSVAYIDVMCVVQAPAAVPYTQGPGAGILPSS